MHVGEVGQTCGEEGREKSAKRQRCLITNRGAGCSGQGCDHGRGLGAAGVMLFLWRERTYPADGDPLRLEWLSRAGWGL